MSLPKNFHGSLAKVSKLFNPNMKPLKGYHYTKLASFDKILETKSFHLTCYDNLNDPTELSHGLSKFEGLRYKELKNKGIHESYLDFYRSFSEGANSEPQLKAYVMSLSLKEDLLGQWKGYGDDGKGVCFEVDLRKLRHRNSMIGKVEYNTNRQVEIIKRLYTIFIRKVNSDSKKQDINLPPYQKDLCISMFQGEYTSSLLMKHLGWSEEQEIRYLNFVESDSDEIFNFNNSFRVKRIFAYEAITKVMWGPKVTSEEINDLLRKYPSFFDSKVHTKSTIPWR